MSSQSLTEPGTGPEAAPVPTGHGEAGAGLQALCVVARLHHIAADPAHVAHQMGWPPSHQPTPQDLLLAARHLGLKAKLTRSTADRLGVAPLPALALMKDGLVVVLAQSDGQRVLMQDPSGQLQGGRPVIEPLDVFVSQWTGQLILVTSRAGLAGQLAELVF